MMLLCSSLGRRLMVSGFFFHGVVEEEEIGDRRSKIRVRSQAMLLTKL